MSVVEGKALRRKRAVRRAALIGIAMALACHFLPPKYQAVCSTVARVLPIACGLP
jgi:hypothetical protein